MPEPVTGEYILLTGAALSFSLMLLSNSRYQKSRGTGMDSVLAFSVYTGVGGILAMKEKPSIRTILSSLVAAAATVFMMF